MSKSQKSANLRYSNAPARRGVLYRHVTENGFSTIAELSESLGVSEMTIRRDVERLVAEQAIRQVHGGVVPSAAAPLYLEPFGERRTLQQEAKLAIAREAAAEANQSTMIYLDSGTTMVELARLIDDVPGHTVATHSLPALVELSSYQNLTVIGIGGHFQPRTLDFTSLGDRTPLNEIRIPLLYLAAGAASSEGVFSNAATEVLTKRMLVQRAERVVLLADSQKFASLAPLRACSYADIDEIITEAPLPPSVQAACEAHNVIVKVIS